MGPGVGLGFVLCLLGGMLLWSRFWLPIGVLLLVIGFLVTLGA